jgi:ferredoxin
MIVAERKPFSEILEKLRGHKKIIIAGCETCVAECHSGGQKEVEILASQLRIACRKKKIPLEISECSIERQCEPEMIEEHAPEILKHDAVLSLACGVGVQEMAGRFLPLPVYPGLNTTFMGAHTEKGEWEERCRGCGDCILDITAGICPVTRCAKSLLNGPCGGTTPEGMCELSDETPCAWAQIFERLRQLGQLHKLEEIIPSKNWETGRSGGMRKLIREDLE